MSEELRFWVLATVYGLLEGWSRGVARVARRATSAGWLALLLLPVLFGGCPNEGMPYDPVDRVMPMVSEFALTPPADGWRGGVCYVRLTATDNVKVKEVTARLTGPGAPADAFALSLVNGTVQFYQGSVTVPANINADGRDNTYHVTAWATDDAGNTTSVASSLSFTVPAAGTPPAPPGW